jgi:DNA-binding SARP family transcriptional activator
MGVMPSPAEVPYDVHATPAIVPTRVADVRISLLGGFDLVVRGEIVDLPESAQRLVAFLALRRRPQTRLCIAGNLWPDKTDARACANLRSTLWRARLEDGTSILHAKGSLVSVTRGAQLDVRQIEAVKPCTLAGFFLSGTRPDYECLFDELLPGWYDDWVILERERLSQLQLRIAEALARELVDSGDSISATDIAHRTMALDPTGVARDRVLGWIP